MSVWLPSERPGAAAQRGPRPTGHGASNGHLSPGRPRAGGAALSKVSPWPRRSPWAPLSHRTAPAQGGAGPGGEGLRYSSPSPQVPAPRGAGRRGHSAVRTSSPCRSAVSQWGLETGQTVPPKTLANDAPTCFLFSYQRAGHPRPCCWHPSLGLTTGRGQDLQLRRTPGFGEGAVRWA